MVKTFLSYARTDAAKARSIASALEKAGHSIWWDHRIKSGSQFSKEIEVALNAADAVIVLWSESSIDSAWVRDEAAAGRDSGRLIPVQIDKSAPPLGFRQYQGIDLSCWNGRGKAREFQALLGAIETMKGGEETAEVAVGTSLPTSIQSKPPHPARLSILLGLVAIALVAVAVVLFRDRQLEETQTVAVTAAEASAKPLARDLMVKLGILQSARSGTMRLINVDQDDRKDVDFLFEIGGDPTADNLAISLVLTTGGDPNVLWAADLTEDRGGLADLKQRAAFTAARVLGCALEARSQSEPPLKQDTLKLYLNACAILGDQRSNDLDQIIATLKQVVELAPNFQPAWARLLVAQTSRIQGASAQVRKNSAAELRRNVVLARKIDPSVPEAYLAELELIPAPLFAEQVRLADMAFEAAPTNPHVLSGRSLMMLVVGRADAAVEDAQRAKNVDPLSPAVRFAYVEALAVAGRIDAARSEIEEAEKLWPGASKIVSTRYFFERMFGDPKEALRLIRSGAVKGSREQEALLDARLQPTKSNIDRAISLAMANRTDTADWLQSAVQTLGEFDRKEQLFAILLDRHDPREIPYFVDVLFRPAQADLRADPRFMLVASRFGLLRYWRESGHWPDFCRQPDLPYDCQKEAANLR
ncbi:MAG: TIR domain-containing protein [Pseudomonadota bacterium]